MYTGSEEDLMGLPEEEKKISGDVEHKFDYDINSVEEGTNFVPSEPKKKNKDNIIIVTKDDKRKRRSKSSNLF
jgi:hypothetical protein